MAKKDIHSELRPIVAVNITTMSSNTTATGNNIDLLGFEGVEFFHFSGGITDGDYTLIIQEGDTTASYSNVADADLLGLEADASFTDNDDDNKVGKIGYRGSKRYVRALIVSSSVTTGGTVGCLAVLGSPHIAPVSYTAP